MFDAYPSTADLARGGDNGVGWILTAGDFNDIVRELICAGERLIIFWNPAFPPS